MAFLLDIIYSDDYLMVVNKPANLIVTPSETIKDQLTLADILQKEYGIKLERGGIVHRLDKDTSGIILIAKTQIALEALQLQFKERMVQKEYLTLVHGFIEESGVIKGGIGRNPGNREKFIVSEEGRDSETKYEPISNFQFSISNFQLIFNDLNKNQKRRLDRSNYGKFTLLRCLPLTGRTHQIRVHLKYIGFPIVGDEKYGGRKTARLDRRWCQRQFLHAAAIQFYHPTTGERLEFGSELPEDLKKALENLDKVS